MNGPALDRARVTGGRLDRALLSGLAWIGGVRWATQALNWATTFVVVRLLTPADFGLVGMALVYIGFVTLVSEFGLGDAVVQRRNLTHDQVARLGGLAVMFGLAFFALSFGAAKPFAWFYGEPAVELVIVVSSLSFVIAGLQVLPKSLLARDLEFRRLAGLEGAQSVLQSIATLTLALTGAGYWALVLGPVIGTGLSTVIAFLLKPHRLAWPRALRTLTSEIAFGWNLVVSRIAWYAYSNADFLLVGRMLGRDPLGAYTVGWIVASVPVERVSAMVGRVTRGVFAEVQDDTAALRRYLLGLTEGIALITFPASIGLALVAEDFVPTILGDQWLAATTPLILLCLYAGFRSIITVQPPVLVATNRTRANMWFSVLTAAVMIPAFAVGARWGTVGVAAAWLIAYPIVVIPLTLRYTLRVVSATWAAYARSLWPAFSGCAVMAAAVFGVNTLGAEWSGAARLAAGIPAGAAAYTATIWWGHRERLRTFLRMIRG